jgi:cell shape-determining protein MreC
MLLLAAATGLAWLPAHAADSVRQIMRSTLRPGLLLTAASRQTVEAGLSLLGNLGSSARHAALLERELEQTRQQRGQLAAELVWLRSQNLEHRSTEEQLLPGSPLVATRLLPARVLGRQAQRFLHSQGILDAGSDAGIAMGDLVLDLPPAIVDRGAASGATSGQLVLSGRRVWGKVARVDPQLCTVRRATDAGFRDLVRVAQPKGNGLSIGPRGVLEGTGKPLCRLRLVSVTQSVAAGQLVITDGGEGLLDGALLYGSIERVEQPSGAAHWDIWVRPAIGPELPHAVSILMAELGRLESAQHEARR